MVKKQDFYKDTVIVIQGDHTSMAAEYIHDTYSSNYDRRVWNAFIHSRVKPKKKKIVTLRPWIFILQY